MADHQEDAKVPYREIIGVVKGPFSDNDMP
jgi:hypothetical protein